MTAANDITCAELVELVTDYLEGALPLADRKRFDVHVLTCPDCGPHLDQMRRTISMLGRIPVETLSSDARSSLLRAFRGWHAAASQT